MLFRWREQVGVLSWVALVATWSAAGLLWMILFRRQGEPIWAAFVPILDWVVLLRIFGRPTWWVLGLLVPGANLVFLALLLPGLLELVKSARREDEPSLPPSVSQPS